jgi:hypothetical protein
LYCGLCIVLIRELKFQSVLLRLFCTHLEITYWKDTQSLYVYANHVLVQAREME